MVTRIFISSFDDCRLHGGARGEEFQERYNESYLIKESDGYAL